MDIATKPTARKNGLVIQEMPGEVLVYDIDSNKAHCLNRSAADIWLACDGSNSISEIVDRMESLGQGAVSEDFVWLAIDQLEQNGLLVGELPRRDRKQSRRQAIKALALTTAVALPVIASLVAPRDALAAASCVCPSPGVPASCATRTGCPSLFNCNQLGLCAPNVVPPGAG